MTFFAGLPVGTFTVSVASDTWMIEHNFGMPTAVDVFVLNNGLYEKIYPLSVTMSADYNTTAIVFSQPWAGHARLTGIRG